MTRLMDGSTVEVRSRSGWRTLSKGPDFPTVTESGMLHLRGLAPEEVLFLGPLDYVADQRGYFSVRLLEEERLRGHLGLVEVRRQSGQVAGEFEVLPDKMSDGAFKSLRAALERMWAGLIFDPGGVSRLRGQLPSPSALWLALEEPVRNIVTEPRSVIASGEGVRRMESVRRPSELTASVVRSGQLQRAGRSRVLIREVDTPENTLVAETLRRLVFYARRHVEGAEVATRASRLLRQQPFVSCGALRGGIEAARLRVLHDARYRRVDRVLRVLDRPEAHATEGPGEARLGVKAIIRLYEFWVFLQVLEACRERYGVPLEPGFQILGQQSRSGITRLAIPAGATVSFPGEVDVSFEPRIMSSGRGWQGLENVPHPDRHLAQDLITPDVVVLRRGIEPALVVFDAKYVARHMVDYEASKIHARYSRIRLHGRPVVQHVLAAHPHQGKDALWAGYGSVKMAPGQTANLTGVLP